MKNKLATMFGLAAGFVGGAMSHYLFLSFAVQAQAQAQPPAEIRAQKFVLVGENGQARAVFGFDKHAHPAFRPDYPGIRREHEKSSVLLE